MNEKPALPIVLGEGSLAEAMRAQIARDPDRYRPETWGTQSLGPCPCCGEIVYWAKTRETGWEQGILSREARRVHPRMNANAEHDPEGTFAGCCCVPPNWGPKHVSPERSDDS